jgi:hypothetical protein
MTPENLTENLPPLIEYLQLGRCGAISYTDHVTRALADDLQVVRYEDLLTDPLAALFPVFCRFSDHQYDRHRLEQVVSQQSFEAETGRRAGVAAPASYIRKGISGDWRNHFDRAAARVLDGYSGETLVRLGYESKREWVGSVR